MATTFTLYDSFVENVMKGLIDLDLGDIKVCLVTSAYTPSMDHEVLADALASPSPEVAAVASPDNGYTAGGEALTTRTVTKIDSPFSVKLDADDLTWSNLTATFRYAIVYAKQSLGSPAVTNPLIGYILFNDAPDDVEVTGVDFTIKWNASGIISGTKA